MNFLPLSGAGGSLGKPPQGLWGGGKDWLHPSAMPQACPSTGRTQQSPRHRCGTGKGDNVVIESPAVPGRLPGSASAPRRGMSGQCRLGIAERGITASGQAGDCAKRWLGGRGGGGGAGLLIGACGDLLDPCKWGHSSVGVLCPPPSHLASFVMRALRSPELPRRQDLTSEPFRAPASVSAPQAEKPSSPPG